MIKKYMRVKNRYERWGFYLSVISLLVSFSISAFTLSVASKNLEIASEVLQVRSQQLQLQNIANNYTALLTGSGNPAQLGEPNSWFRSGNITRTTHYGIMSVPVTIIAPHYMQLIIKIKEFHVEESEYLDPEKLEENSISFSNGQPYTEFLDIGLNKITPNLQLKATVYPDADALSSLSEAKTIYLGTLELKAKMVDLQTHKENWVLLSGRIYVTLKDTG
jgi:hypothetical protein